MLDYKKEIKEYVPSHILGIKINSDGVAVTVEDYLLSALKRAGRRKVSTVRKEIKEVLNNLL